MICAVVLAAGRSERMGTQKLLLPLGGKPVIARVVDELLRSPVEQVLVVIGSDGKSIREALVSRPVQFVANPDSASDMLGSVRCGLRALPATCEAILIALGDQPGVSGKLVGEMINIFRSRSSRIVVPVLNGSRGHPVLLSSRFRDELLSHHEGCGLRGLLEAHAEEVFGLVVSDRSLLDDMDTPEDYRRHRNLFSESFRR